jgi:two-component system CheB/CheR fusion protein
MAKSSNRHGTPEPSKSAEPAESAESAVPLSTDPNLPSLVVVGASAGGVEALSTLVSTLPARFPVPIVLAQHLDPSHPSHLGEILARYSQMPVRTVTDQAPLLAGTIYVIPSDRNVEISDHALHLLGDSGPRRPMPSIDRLFSSAARVYGEQLIAVILTGTGSDGASGAYQVKAAGGVVIIENPETAAYPALPASLAPTTVDFIADLERIGPLLYAILTGSSLPPRLVGHTSRAEVEETPALPLDSPEYEQALQTLLNLVRERSNIDFSRYKTPTIQRRLQRRIFATDTADLPAYLRYLESNPDEYQRLIGSFLIKVTEFFRDPELFDELKEHVLPELVADARMRGNVLRIWSAGCATGEEAYSLAILVSEVLGAELDQFTVQIFATDVDDDAVDFARHGIYPAAALDGVSPQHLARYFHKLDGNYQVTKSLRGLVIFGVHDLGLRAGFPHIDLVLCRNVLMYFTMDLQVRALQLFAFSLRDGGYLALGSAESTSPLAAYFTQVSSSLKLYRREGNRTLGPIPTYESLLHDLGTGAPRPRGRAAPYTSVRASRLGAGKRPPLPEVPAQPIRNSRERLGLLVLGLPIGVVVVNRRYDIQMINGNAMRLLGVFTEPIGEDLIHLAQSIPSNALRTVIDSAFRATQSPTQQPEAPQHFPAPTEPGDHMEGVITVETLLGERRNLQFTCYPYVQPPVVGEAEVENAAELESAVHPPSTTGAATHQRGIDAPLVLIFVRDVTDIVQAHEQASRAIADRQAQSQAEQARVQSELETVADRLRSENERLKTEVERQGNINRTLLEGNQTLATANLDLRAANEELQVSAEEAEASTEEVKTLNEELQASNEELVTLNEELEATVEELHAANEELQARTREMQEMAAKLEEGSKDASA